jgi:hypothetical protein
MNRMSIRLSARGTFTGNRIHLWNQTELPIRPFLRKSFLPEDLGQIPNMEKFVFRELTPIKRQLSPLSYS